MRCVELSLDTNHQKQADLFIYEIEKTFHDKHRNKTSEKSSKMRNRK